MHKTLNIWKEGGILVIATIIVYKARILIELKLPMDLMSM